MKGLELGYKFYKEFGETLLHENFPFIEQAVCVGLIGSGSECLKLDDDTSQDHDFEPGFCIFVPNDIDDKILFQLEKAYSSLPKEYNGYKRQNVLPTGGARHGVKKIEDFLLEKTGTKNAKLTTYDYLNIPEQNLLELTNGEIWKDDNDLITSIRANLTFFPEDIKLKKLASNILIMAQAGQYNFIRCIKHNEKAAAKLAAIEFIKSAIHCLYLFNNLYMPYYKWQFKLIKNYCSNEDILLLSKIESLLTINDFDFENAFFTIEEISNSFIEKIKSVNLSNQNVDYLEKYAYDINSHIKDNELRNMHILSAIL